MSDFYLGDSASDKIQLEYLIIFFPSFIPAVFFLLDSGSSAICFYLARCLCTTFAVCFSSLRVIFFSLYIFPMKLLSKNVVYIRPIIYISFHDIFFYCLCYRSFQCSARFFLYLLWLWIRLLQFVYNKSLHHLYIWILKFVVFLPLWLICPWSIVCDC